MVLVAALVVPLTVIPGTFGFQSWPTAPGGTVTENQVAIATPPRVQVAREAQHAAKATGGRTIANPTSPKSATPAAPAPAPTPPGHRAPAVAQVPAAHAPSRDHHSPATTPVGPPSTPAAPQQQPAPAPQDGQPAPSPVVSNDPPIAREDPAADPVVPQPPAPVQQFVPDEQPAPQDVGNGNGNGNGNGRGDEHGNGHDHSRGHGVDIER
jgi:hypothetical protein